MQKRDGVQGTLDDPNYIGTISTRLAENKIDGGRFMFLHDREEGYATHIILHKGKDVFGYVIIDGEFKQTRYRSGEWEEELREIDRKTFQSEQVATRPEIPASFTGQLALPGFQ